MAINSRYTKSIIENNTWTEVVSRKQQQNDPFAGMKSSVDYELEIERLKQLIPKINLVKKLSFDKKPEDNHISLKHDFSRPNSPDTTHSTDSDNSTSSFAEIVTEEEKMRFLAFVRSWAGDWRKGQPLMNQWMPDQSPWHTGSRRVSAHLHTCSVRPIGFERKFVL